MSPNSKQVQIVLTCHELLRHLVDLVSVRLLPLCMTPKRPWTGAGSILILRAGEVCLFMKIKNR
jgi:hypothetical protein